MTCEDVLESARAASVLVVGDICLDRWCRYDPALSEPSRETGIPRVAVTESTVTPGAGGTVAGNLAALRVGRVCVAGVIGRDGNGFDLRRSLDCRGIETGLLLDTDRASTFTYTKLINSRSGIEDLARVDIVNATELSQEDEARLLDRLLPAIGDFDAVIVADQAETDRGGVVTPTVRDALCEQARRRSAKVFVADSRRRVLHFRDMIVTPNEAEASEACRQAFGEVDYPRLHGTIGGPALVVTDGERGALLVDGDGVRRCPARDAGEAVDTCGAGDSFTAGLAVALVAGAGIEDAVGFGIIVAAVTVTKSGTGSASPAEVLAAETAAER